MKLFALNRYSKPNVNRNYNHLRNNLPYKSFSLKVNFNNAKICFQSKSNLELFRSYLVFQICRSKFLVTNSEFLLNKSYQILGNNITNMFLKLTFFGHFCAGEDTNNMKPTISKLEKVGIGSILDYAAEADIPVEEQKPLTKEQSLIQSRVYDYLDEQLCDKRTEVFRSCIQSAYELNNESSKYPGFAAIKCTALGNPMLLERISNTIIEIRNLFLKFDIHKKGIVSKEDFKTQYKLYFAGGMDVEDVFQLMDTTHDDNIDYIEWTNMLSIEDLHKITSYCITRGPLAKSTLTEEERDLLLVMRNRINSLAELADQLNVRLMIDAEHSYFQPAIDNIAMELMRKYNKKRALIFTTYQMYLKDSFQRLIVDYTRTKSGNYYFAVKLVRGAYMDLERNRAKEMNYLSPIHMNINDTHTNYNNGITYLIDLISKNEKVELMIASHNQNSIELALSNMDSYNLINNAPIYFGQLLGMSDHLTYTLGSVNYRAYKYVPYGKVKEVMPYLIRRAQENSNILGGLGFEIKMLNQEIKRRLFGN